MFDGAPPLVEPDVQIFPHPALRKKSHLKHAQDAVDQTPGRRLEIGAI